MKITEVTKSATQALHEAIDQNNHTGFLTEDLVKIVEQDQSGDWSEPMSADDLLAEMDGWTA